MMVVSSHGNRAARALLAALAVTLLLAASASAGDRLGSYVVRGVGIKSCAEFLKAEQTSTEAVQPYVSWIDGYLSAANRLQDDTADASPLIESGFVAILVRNLCRGDQSLRVETALGRLMRFFEPYRIRTVSPVVEVPADPVTLKVYEETLRWAQETLVRENLFDGEVDGQYTDSMRQALASYQEQRGLPVNGLPDAQTLLALFREFPAE